jgi:hypothetical protein
MIKNINAVQVGSGITRESADLLLISNDRDSGNSIADAHLGSLDRARVVPF